MAMCVGPSSVDDTPSADSSVWTAAFAVSIGLPPPKLMTQSARHCSIA
jgi:hypothetical protein